MGNARIAAVASRFRNYRQVQELLQATLSQDFQLKRVRPLLTNQGLHPWQDFLVLRPLQSLLLICFPADQRSKQSKPLREAGYRAWMHSKRVKKNLYTTDGRAVEVCHPC